MDYYKIFNKNTFKIIELMKKEKRALYFNEIAEKTGIKSKNNLLKNLLLLSQANLIKKKISKSNTYYIIRKESPINLVLFTLIDEVYINSLPFEVKKIIEELRRGIDAKYIFLFGSYARGDYTKNSDVDILIINLLKKHNLKKISEELYVLYNKKVHIEVLNKLEKNNFTEDIFNHAIPIKNQFNYYEENKDEIFRLLD